MLCRSPAAVVSSPGQAAQPLSCSSSYQSGFLASSDWVDLSRPQAPGLLLFIMLPEKPELGSHNSTRKLQKELHHGVQSTARVRVLPPSLSLRPTEGKKLSHIPPFCHYPKFPSHSLWVPQRSHHIFQATLHTAFDINCFCFFMLEWRLHVLQNQA